MFFEQEITTRRDHPEGPQFQTIIEEWAPVIYRNVKPGLYLISSLGRVYSYPKRGLKSLINGNGYLHTTLQSVDNTPVTCGIHRLVATAFVYNPDPVNKIFVNHKNLMTQDNTKNNLEWVTEQENSLHCARYYHSDIAIPKSISTHSPKSETNNWNTPRYGEENGMSILTEQQVHIICQTVQAGGTYKQAATAVGIEPNRCNTKNISKIISGSRWLHVRNQYDITPPKRGKFKDFDDSIDQYITDGLSNEEILNILPLPSSVEINNRYINTIRDRRKYGR